MLFFDRKPASETPWTRDLWIYDLRTNRRFTPKDQPAHPRRPGRLRSLLQPGRPPRTRGDRTVPPVQLRRPGEAGQGEPGHLLAARRKHGGLCQPAAAGPDRRGDRRRPTRCPGAVGRDRSGPVGIDGDPRTNWNPCHDHPPCGRVQRRAGPLGRSIEGRWRPPGLTAAAKDEGALCESSSVCRQRQGPGRSPKENGARSQTGGKASSPRDGLAADQGRQPHSVQPSHRRAARVACEDEDCGMDGRSLSTSGGGGRGASVRVHGQPDARGRRDRRL